LNQPRNVGEKELQVRVQYLGFIKNMLNKKEEHFELEEGTILSDLLNKLAAVHGAPFRKEVYEPGVKQIKTPFNVFYPLSDFLITTIHSQRNLRKL